MSTIAEVQSALERLSEEDRRFIARWLDGDAQNTGLPPVAEPVYMTEENYLEFEERSPERHEYVNGFVYAMCCPSVAHGRVVSRIQFALARRLGDGPCEAFSSGLKVQVATATDNQYLYPDLMVSCDRTDWKEKWLLGPRLIVEVLSPSTQHIDRREKATTYRTIPSMEEYAIAAQRARQLTIFRRAEGWTAEIVSGPQAVAEFRSLGLSIPLAEIYRGVFPE